MNVMRVTVTTAKKAMERGVTVLVPNTDTWGLKPFTGPIDKLPYEVYTAIDMKDYDAVYNTPELQ